MNNSAVSVSLQSKDNGDLLDIIDKLRSQGISRYVDIPQIIVCGDQSSGKSSALEAISGVAFPTKDNLCTCFATELILRRSPTSSIKVSIIASSDRSDVEKKELAIPVCTADKVDVGELVEQAKAAMGLTSSGKVFSKDVLRIEISGPTQPHLTLVDLPGLFMAGNRDQSAEDAGLVKSLVLDYMERPRSIILAVVSAKNDFALQQVTEHTRAVDPKGYRTLGLITKPDTLDEGSESERFYVDLAQNKDVNFRLGWHVLRNRDFTTRNSTMAERDAAEAKFFSSGIWKILRQSQLGVVALRTRLSNVLQNQILDQLPNVIEDVQKGLVDCRTRIDKLGAPRLALAEQRRYLVKASEAFYSLIKAAINGEYTHVFFCDSSSSVGFKKRLRAVVQKRLSDFAKEMRLNGEAKQIVEEEPVVPGSISRSNYMDEVEVLMERSRGRELPGMFNPLLVAELFRKQSAPWKAIANAVSDLVFSDADATVNLILQFVVDEETVTGLLRRIVRPTLDAVKASLTARVAELLEPHTVMHPITYNPHLRENVQSIQADRLERSLEESLTSFLNTGLVNHEQRFQFNPKALLNTVLDEVEPNMTRYSCSLAIDNMQAYYNIALEKFIDDISVLAIEQNLLQKLPAVLTPEAIFDLPEEDIQDIAAESSDSAGERAVVMEKLDVLENGMAELKQLRRYHARAPETQSIDDHALMSGQGCSKCDEKGPMDCPSPPTPVSEPDHEKETVLVSEDPVEFIKHSLCSVTKQGRKKHKRKAKRVPAVADEGEYDEM